MDEPKKVRLDAYIAQKYPNYSRALIQKLIKNGHVKVDGSIVVKTSTPVNGSEQIFIDEIKLKLPDQPLHLDIIYEDVNCVVINKPLGILVHSKGAYNPEATVASWLKDRKDFDFPADNDRGGIVHRLDRATSGVMICAKNKNTLGFLQKQFQNRKAKKTYVALVEGVPKQDHAIIDLPIDRNPKKPQTFRVSNNGKTAQTEYKMLKTDQKTSLLELKPVTGRTHQLRVHMNYINNPIVGDVLYGGKIADRMYLHAKSLEITIPGGERKVFDSELPKEFELK
jgi:23S rRNA pseudouridine1911/1915/1917 synthase